MWPDFFARSASRKGVAPGALATVLDMARATGAPVADGLRCRSGVGVNGT